MELIIRIVLLVSFFLSVVEGRPRRHSKQISKTRGTKAKEVGSEVTLKTTCPAYPSAQNTNRKYCTQMYDTCRKDTDCGIAIKCCFDGCVYTCTEPVVKKSDVIDWLKKPTAQRVSGDAWLIEGKSVNQDKKIMCSTSNFTTDDPLLCPTGYICDIKREEKKEEQIPNRGLCITDPYKEIDPFETQEWTYDDAYDSQVCYYRGKKLDDGQYFFNNCNFCFCSNSIINCQLTPCSTSKPKFAKLLANPGQTADTLNNINGFTD